MGDLEINGDLGDLGIIGDFGDWKFIFKKIKMKEILQKQIDTINKQFWALESSYNHIKKLNLDELVSYEDLEPVDAYLDRFSRFVDYLFSQLFRTIYMIENMSWEHPTNRQLALFVVKKWLVDSLDNLSSLKQLRNKLAHEYIDTDTEFVINQINNFLPLLSKILENVETYYEKL